MLTDSPFRLEPLGPFFAPHIAEQTDWRPAAIERAVTYANWTVTRNQGMTDVLFGLHVNHVPILLVIDSIFAFWFLLAVVRNIKRDSAEYELYSPRQFLGLAVFLNLLLVAFFNWHFHSDIDQPTFLLTSIPACLSCSASLYFAIASERGSSPIAAPKALPGSIFAGPLRCFLVALLPWPR